MIKLILIVLAIVLLIWVNRARLCREGMAVNRTLEVNEDVIIHGDVIQPGGSSGSRMIDTIIISNQADLFGNGNDQARSTRNDIRIPQIMAVGPYGANLLDVQGQKLAPTPETTGAAYNDIIWQGTPPQWIRNFAGDYRINVHHVKGKSYGNAHPAENRHLKNILKGNHLADPYQGDMFEAHNGEVTLIHIKFVKPTRNADGAWEAHPVPVSDLIMYLAHSHLARRYMVLCTGADHSRTFSLPRDLPNDHINHVMNL